MTFNENDIVRDTDGRFGEKPQSAPEAALRRKTAGEDMWEMAVDARAEAEQKLRDAAEQILRERMPAGARGARLRWYQPMRQPLVTVYFDGRGDSVEATNSDIIERLSAFTSTDQLDERFERDTDMDGKETWWNVYLDEADYGRTPEC